MLLSVCHLITFTSVTIAARDHYTAQGLWTGLWTFCTAFDILDPDQPPTATVEYRWCWRSQLCDIDYILAGPNTKFLSRAAKL